MRHTFSHKIVSFLLLIVILTLSTAGLCRDACADEIAMDKSIKSASSAGSFFAAEKTVPICPYGQQSDNGNRCDSCRYCSCHAPLISQPVQVVYSAQVIYITSSEPFKAFPEVYLSKFVPPHILV